MKKRKVLLISLLTTLLTPLLSSCSAGPFIPWDIPEVSDDYARPNASKFNEVIDNFKTAVNYDDEEQIKGYYDQLNDYLDYILALREAVNTRQTNIAEDKIGEELTFLYNYYWTLKAKEVDATQSAIKSFFHSNAVKSALGEEITNKYLSIETDKMMVNRKYVHYENDHVTQYTEKILKNASNEKKGTALLIALSNAALSLFDLIEAYSICSVRANLDTVDNYYNKELTYVTNLVFSSQNEYRKAILALINSPHRELMEETLGKEQVDSFLESAIVLNDDLLEIQQNETELVSTYSGLTTEGKKELYVNLIKNRNSFTNIFKTSYPSSTYNSYAEYIYDTTFFRDYTPTQVTSLVNSISTTFGSTWNKAISARQNIPGVVTESDLWNALEYTDNIIENGPSIRQHIKDYGLYCFDSNPNSYDGAFVLTIQSIDYNDFFMLVNTSNTLNDYTTVIHEFGHYYSNMVEDESLSTSAYPSLDLSEINSQGLEMLMMDHYNNFMTDEEADALKKNQVGNALWALFSGSAVSEFENYAYTLSNPTVALLDEKWNELKEKYNLTNYSLSYEMIPHIYQQPFYYISYVTSIISTLELWSLPTEKAKETYNTLAKLGSYNEYLKTLEENGLSNPFGNISLLEKLNTKLDSLL